MPNRLGSQRAVAWLLLLLFLLLQQHSSAQLEPPGTKLSELLLKRYLSNEEQAAWLQEFAHKCKDISRVFSVGNSVMGQHLWVLEISDKPGQAEPEPNFKYVGNMHGDEPSGRVLLAQLAEHICSAYKAQDPLVTRLVQDLHLYLMPSMNPDGFKLKRRENAKNVDLNRNFPDPVELRHNMSTMRQPLPNAQPETLAMMQWVTTTKFVASANLHEGAVVANYPYDGFTDHSMKVNGSRHPTPDDATFTHLAKVYAAAHKDMARSAEFKDGIVNGAQWYPVYGGMQDWTYLVGCDLDITLELSENKWRPAADLPLLWEENKDALLALPLAAALGGVRGVVVSAEGGKPVPATIVVEGNRGPNTTADTQFGYYNRPLAPGSYRLTALHPGFAPSSVAVVVPEDGSGVVQDFKLPPASAAAAAAASKAADATAAAGTVAAAGTTAAAQKAAAPGGTADWEGDLSMSTHPVLKHLVLRSHHMVGLALAGLALCAVGGWALMRTTHGKVPGLWGQVQSSSSSSSRPQRREYELVGPAANGAAAAAANRV